MSEPILKKRKHETITAMRIKYDQLVTEGFFVFHLFTLDKHSILIHVTKTKTNKKYYLNAAVNDDLEILSQVWIQNSHGFADFVSFINKVIEKAQKIRNCAHCKQLCSVEFCAMCTSYLVAPLFLECIACHTSVHPVAWRCLTCEEAIYCTVCNEKQMEHVPKGIMICPICKEQNETIFENEPVLCIEDLETDMMMANRTLTNLERICYYIQHCLADDDTIVTITPETLLEVNIDSILAAEIICKQLAAKGFPNYLCCNPFWTIVVDVDCRENNICPLSNSTFFA